jgi:hypothetical protein
VIVINTQFLGSPGSALAYIALAVLKFVQLFIFARFQAILLLYVFVVIAFFLFALEGEMMSSATWTGVWC